MLIPQKAGRVADRAMALFTKKDLGLLLPDDAPSDPASLRHTQSRCAPLPVRLLAPLDSH